MKKIKKLWWLFLIIVIALALWWWFANRDQEVSYSTVNVIRGPLVQTVSESGTLKPVRELSLNFLSSGRVQSLSVSVGDKVTAGMELAALDNSALQSRKLEAEAGLKIAEASLDKLLAGASGENLAVSRAAINQAQANVDATITELEKIKATTAENLRQAKKTLADLESDSTETVTPSEQAVASALTTLNNAEQTGTANINNARSSAIISINDKILSAKVALDNINTILEDKDAEAVLSVKNSSLLSKTEDARTAALLLVGQADALANQMQADESKIVPAAQALQSLLRQVSTTLDYAYAMLEATITSVNFSQANLDAYKNLVSSQSSQINAASLTIESASQAYQNAVLNKEVAVANAYEAWRQTEVALDNAILAARNNVSNLELSRDQQIAAVEARLASAEKALLSAKAQFSSTAAPARAQDIALTRAQISQAQAALAGVEQQLSETVLTAPLDGVITEVNYEIGEQFGPGTKAMIVMLVDNSFNIEVDIAESNISKIKIGDEVDITFDALSDDFVIKGVVSFIEPARTLIQDVVYYKVKVEFENLQTALAQIEAENFKLKAGLTSNVVITTDSRDKVLQVPARTIIEQDGAKIARVVENGEIVEKMVVTGLRGDDGLIEVLSGLEEGDQVVTFIRD